MCIRDSVRPEEITDEKIIVAARTVADRTQQHSAVPLGVYMARKGEITWTRSSVYEYLQLDDD
eukprot:1555834-Prorocentrum_lima.AAC.1